jgi:hypothetical protein
MIYISYRGVFDGQNFDKANTVDQIGRAFNAGFGCMVDIWRVDGIMYLGSDEPVTIVTEKYLQGNKFWLNVRNVECQEWIVTQSAKLYPNYFWFNNDMENTPTETSSGKLITPGNVPVNNTSIIFLPEIPDRGLLSTVHLRCYGVCSNYLTFIKRMRNEGEWY